MSANMVVQAQNLDATTDAVLYAAQMFGLKVCQRKTYTKQSFFSLIGTNESAKVSTIAITSCT